MGGSGLGMKPRPEEATGRELPESEKIVVGGLGLV
jgi:hypothetical protein